MLPEKQSHLVMTDSETGITDEDADKVIAILNGMDDEEKDIKKNKI